VHISSSKDFLRLFFPLDSEGALDARVRQIREPKFEECKRSWYQGVHDWRKYIPEEMRERWEHLVMETRCATYVIAELQADEEVWE
jgi:hypothetical protein